MSTIDMLKSNRVDFHGSHVTHSDVMPHVVYGQRTSLIPFLDCVQIKYCMYNIANNNISISNEII